MKKTILLLLIMILYNSCTKEQIESEKPHVAFTFDDGSSKDILSYKATEWNTMIRKQLKENGIQSVWFVRGGSVDNEIGKKLLEEWDNDGHYVANHTYNHQNFNSSKMTCKSFINDILKCDSLIGKYQNYQKIVRFPYLKGGKTVVKRDSLRSYLAHNNYKQGWVTIDASDWYVNMRLIKRLKENPDADISGYREYYVNHIFERAEYYNNLSNQLNNRQIKHNVLLHFNLTSALFLNDLIEKFKSEGWVIDNYSEAIKDPIYSKEPLAIPTEQSLIWILAKETEKFELRYPGEDGVYEKDKMDKLGL